MDAVELAERLKKYVPIGAQDYCASLVYEHKVHLKIAAPRLSKLGDYRPGNANTPHRVSVNVDLNPYAFLITFLHEMAHLTNFTQFGNAVAPHGIEWKKEFQLISKPVLDIEIFPADVFAALNTYIQNPYASSCADPSLMRVLHKYDPNTEFVLVEDIALNARFKLKNGMEFIKLAKNRTRFKCREIATNKMYLVSGVSECKLL